MRCDNHCPSFGDPDETVNHVSFQCPPVLQTWALALTPLCPGTFPTRSVYNNMDYLFWRKSEFEDPDLDKDPYLWII